MIFLFSFVKFVIQIIVLVCHVKVVDIDRLIIQIQNSNNVYYNAILHFNILMKQILMIGNAHNVIQLVMLALDQMYSK